MNKKNLALGIGGAAGAIIAWKLLTRPDTVSWEQNRALIDHNENSHFVDVDGIRVHYQEFGDRQASTLILVHGFTSSTFVWKTSAPMLAEKGHHVIAYDLPGFGYSEKPYWFDYSIASQARILGRLMNRLGIGRATLVGSSYGGAVCAWFALDHAERVDKLILVDAVCNNEPKSHPVMQLAGLRGVGEVITPFLVDSKAFLRYRMQNTLAPENHHLITEDRVESIQRPLRAADGHRSVLLTSRNWDASRIENDAHLISQPTLLIWGESDNVIPLRNGQNLYDSILNSRLVVLTDCGHIPQEEQPGLFVDLVSDFSNDAKKMLREQGSGVGS